MDIVYFPIKSYDIDIDRLKNGVIIIDIELKDRNRIKEFFQNFHSKAEDLLFTIIQKLPEKLIPSPLMDWLEKYLDKRISELKQETIKMTWQNMYLQEAVDDIHSRQQDTKEAPSDDWLSSLGASFLFEHPFWLCYNLFV